MPIKNLQNKALLASVFFTGAAVLVVEIVAIRVLSPYFGNTIYTTSSVIGTILGALSLGYYVGGKNADKYPYYQAFYGIIAVSGILVMGVHLLRGALPMLSLLFSLDTGPLVSSVLLFFVPAFCLGTLSPFAIKLNSSSTDYPLPTTHSQIGSQSGQVFFWSTLGSIAGSLATGFFLIPRFGIAGIILGTGTILAVWGCVGLFYYALPAGRQAANRKVLFAICSVLLAILVFLWLGAATARKDLAVIPGMALTQNLELIYEKDGVYEKIRVAEGEWEGKPARFLFQDRSFSAAMFLHSDELVYDYSKYYSLYRLAKPEATRALVIGGGAYSIPKALLADSPDMRVDVSEIEPGLYDLSKTYFNLKENPRLANYIQDGRQLLRKNTTAYDTIFSDVYFSLFSVPQQFTTREFFELARSRLTENGVFMGNFIGYLGGSQPSFINSEIKTFQQTFPNSYFFAVNSPSSTVSQNIIFMGINGTKKPALGGALTEKLIDTGSIDLAANYELTDNFAPVDYLAGKAMQQW